jgi:hypothetical protein
VSCNKSIVIIPTKDKIRVSDSKFNIWELPCRMKREVKVMNVGAPSPYPDWKTPYPFKVLTSKPLTPTKWDSKIINLGAYPTTCTIIVQDPLGNALNLGAYPTTCTIIVWDPLGNALDLGPYPTTCTIIVRDPLGNALDLGPYPTTCTILVWDPFEGLEMPLILGLTLLQVLSLRRTH